MVNLGPGARRRFLGKALRELREQRKMSLNDAAKIVPLSAPALSRIEGGKCAILARNVYRLCQIYDVPERRTSELAAMAETRDSERGWWEEYADVFPAYFEIYASLEADATDIWVYEPEFVPGILQTADTMRAMFEVVQPDLPSKTVERMVESRLTRQEHLKDTQTSIIINEAILHRPIGPAHTFRQQLHRLQGQVRVLPFSAGMHPAMGGSFTLFKFLDEEIPSLLYIEDGQYGNYYERADDLARHAKIFQRLERDYALSTKDSAEFISALIE